MVPEHYRDLDTSGVLFEPPVSCLVVEGPDRVSWLQGMVSNDVGRLAPGQGCLAAHLTPQGKVVAILKVLADPERIWLLTDRQSDLASRLERLLIMEEARIEDRSDQVHILSLIGRRAEAILEEELGWTLGLHALYDHRKSGEGHVVRTKVGCDLITPAGSIAKVRKMIERHGIRRGGEALYALAMIEAGIPRWGVDLDSGVTLPELGEESIDYKKGCYIGQEVVAKIKYIGHVNRRLAGLRIEGSQVPAPGPLVRQGREVGRLTSALWSPSVEGIIGLAYVRSGAGDVGTEVQIPANGQALKAVVAALPFVERMRL